MIGFSRLGKAALNKRAQGETVGKITKSFPHWFCRNFAKHAEKEAEMTFDQHQLLACIAPRPIYVASASKDKWADPEGEFLSLVHAAPVYALFKDAPFEGKSWPKPGTAIGGQAMLYHLREGSHNITPWDWRYYIQASKELLGE